MIQYDERVGCVAVYHGEPRDCLSGIQDEPTCVFYGAGRWDGDRWYVPRLTLWRARLAYRRALRRQEGET